MKPFGKDSFSYTQSYGLPMLISHLEGLLDSETDEYEGASKKHRARIELVEQAIDKLTRAADMAGEV